MILVFRTLKELLKQASVVRKHPHQSWLNLFNSTAIQNANVKTYFILIPETRIARLEGSRLECSGLEGLAIIILSLGENVKLRKMSLWSFKKEEK